MVFLVVGGCCVVDVVYVLGDFDLCVGYGCCWCGDEFDVEVGVGCGDGDGCGG